MIKLKDALTDAHRRRIAIGHFNVSDLVGLEAVTGAAQKLSMPVLARGNARHHEAKKSRQLAGMIKPPHVADFSDDPCRSGEGYAPHCLERVNNGAERPLRKERLDLLFDQIPAFDRLIHGIEIGLKGNLLRRICEALIGT